MNEIRRRPEQKIRKLKSGNEKEKKKTGLKFSPLSEKNRPVFVQVNLGNKMLVLAVNYPEQDLAERLQQEFGVPLISDEDAGDTAAKQVLKRLKQSSYKEDTSKKPVKITLGLGQKEGTAGITTTAKPTGKPIFWGNLYTVVNGIQILHALIGLTEKEKRRVFLRSRRRHIREINGMGVKTKIYFVPANKDRFPQEGNKEVSFDEIQKILQEILIVSCKIEKISDNPESIVIEVLRKPDACPTHTVFFSP